MTDQEEILSTDDESITADSPEQPIPEETAPDNTSALRAEIERLQGEVTRLSDLQTRSRQELDEFCSLFPGVPVSGLPDEVQKQVDGGVPLPAAYALYEKREAMRQSATRKSAERSWHGMRDASSGEYFSPAEVRSMSQKEVHKNYKKIMESMKHWK